MTFVEPNYKWHRRFIALAKHIARWSKDPSTKTGAVIVDSQRRVVSMGYNGFPQRVDDDPERYADREVKYRYIVHADANALLFAQRPLNGCTIYTWPFMPCSQCAGLVVQSGIVACVCPVTTEAIQSRWGCDLAISRAIFEEGGVDLYEF